MSETSTFSCEHFNAHPPEEVWRALTDPDLLARWRALTDPDLLARWWAPGDVRPVVGHRFSLDMGIWGQRPCEVIAVDPPKLLAYTFAGGSLDTIITWRLAPEGAGTRLLLEHEGFDLDSPLGRQAYDGMGAGWPDVLARIGGALDAAGVTGG